MRSVLGSRRPNPPRPLLTLNQMMPFGARVMPWVCAARPFTAGTLNSLTAPVLLSILPMVVRRFGMLQVNQSWPSRSSQASCTPHPGMRTEGVPSDQSLPSFCTKLLGRPASGSSGTSYSLNMTRAASPDGRGSGVNLMALSPGPRAREIGRQFLLMVVENAGRLALVTHERAVDVGILHQLDDGVPAGLVESVLKRVARGVAAGANIAHEPFHALVLLGLLGQRRQHDVAR